MSLWVYRGEGNAHIVVSHKQKHIVYRMFKRKKNGVCSRKKFKTDYQHLREKVLKYLAFNTNVMLPRIDRRYLHCGSLVEISHSLVQNIKESLENRPEYRQDKELDENCPYVLEMPDYCHVNQHTSNNCCNPQAYHKHSQPVYTIEIKPKWGFLPVTKSISPANRIKYSVCRFCMHQHLKVSTGKWKYHSCYCPIDLFSGDRARMKHSLRMLFASPQNNFNIFKDGKVLWNDFTRNLPNSEEVFLREFFQGTDKDTTQDIKSLRSQFDCFLELLVHCLLRDNSGKSDTDPAKPSHVPSSGCTASPVIQNGQDSAPLYVQTCAASKYRNDRKPPSQDTRPEQEHDSEPKVSTLPRGCVLYQILKIQLMDDIDVEGIRPLYEMVRDEIDTASSGSRFDINGPYDVKWCPEGATTYPDKSNKMIYAAQKIKEFLVSRSAKDCSIMISVKPHPDQNLCRPVLSETSSQCTPTTDLKEPFSPTKSNGHGASCSGLVEVGGNSVYSSPAHEPSAWVDPDGDPDQSTAPDGPPPQSSGPNQRSSRTNSNFLAIDKNDRKHIASIAVIDLDPKPFDRIKGYLEEDREVVQHYTEYLNLTKLNKESLF